MALYAGLSPEQALAKWYDIRKKAGYFDPNRSHQGPGAWNHDAITPEEDADIWSNMEGLAKDNPDAWDLYRKGAEISGDEDHFKEFNTMTGEWDTKEHHGYWSHPESWLQLGFGGALAGVGVAGAIGSGASAAGAGGSALGPTSAGSIAATSAGAAAPVSIAAGGGTVAGTVATGAGGASLWKTLAAPAIGAGTQVAGELINAHQQDKATEAELQKAKEAQAFLEKKYEQTQNQVAPYVNMGQGALAMLGSGLGVTPANPAVLQPGQTRPVGQTRSGFIPPDDFTAFKQQAQAQNPTAQIPGMENQAASAQSLSQSGVRMQSPDGKDTAMVSRDKVPFYLQQGAKVIQ